VLYDLMAGLTRPRGAIEKRLAIELDQPVRQPAE
jgi:hypothetical protein